MGLHVHATATGSLMWALKSNTESSSYIRCLRQQYESVVLPDGRTLSYTRVGDPAAQPVFYIPSLTGSRLEAHLCADPRICLIGIDRPGYGKSTINLRQTYRSFADDVAYLADHLGLDTFSLFSMSGGAPFAFGIAHYYPERVRKFGELIGLSPFTETTIDSGFVAQFPTGARYPWRTAMSVYGRRLLLSIPTGLLYRSLHLLPRADAEGDSLLSAKNIELFKASYLEGMTQGYWAAAHELCMYTQQWDFDPANVRVPVRIFHGTADEITPVACARYYAEILPRVEYTECEGETHTQVAMRYRAPMIDWLTA